MMVCAGQHSMRLLMISPTGTLVRRGGRGCQWAGAKPAHEKGVKSMCVLCGEALTHVHWTDRRAGERTTVSMFVGDDQQRARMRDRLHLVRLANQILCHYGLR